MPVVPVPLPFFPSFADAKGTWETIETAMGWFSKIFDTLYGYSDGIIKYRQKEADVADQLKRAEKEAFRIMEEQKDGRKKVVEKVLGRRSVEMIEELTWEDWLESLYVE